MLLGGWSALKYEVATVHGVIEVLSSQVVHTRGVKVEAANVRVVDGATA